MYDLFMKKLLLLSFVSIFIVACPGATKAPPGSLVSDIPSLKFDYQPLGTTSKEMVATLTNVSNVDITDIKYGLEKNMKGIFTIGGDCTPVLPAGASCRVAATFTPDTENVFNDKFNFTFESASGPSTASVGLNGNSLPALYDETVGTDLLASGLAVRGATSDKAYDVVNARVSSKPLVTLSAEIGSWSDEVGFALNYTGQDNLLITVFQADADAKHNGKYRVNNLCSTMSNGSKCSVLFSYNPILVDEDTASFIVSVTDSKKNTYEFKTFIKANGANTEWTGAPLTIEPKDGTISGTTAVGAISTVPLELKVTNTSADTIYYKVVSRSPEYTYELGTCNLVLQPAGTLGDNCTMKVYHNPSQKADNSKGYVGVVVGKKAVLASITATSSEGVAETGLEYTFTPKKLEFAKTEQGFTTGTKRVTITANEGLALPKNIISMFVGKGYEQTFRYTTTCIEGRALAAGQRCYADVQFAPASNATIDVAISSTLTVNETTLATPPVTTPKTVAVSGTPVALANIDNTTPIKGLTVDTKRLNFPEIPVGTISGYQQITIKNTNDYDITGFASSSSNLTRFSLDPAKEATDCGPVIPAGGSCKIGYRFNAKDTNDVTGYISIWDSTTPTDLKYNELIEVKARGVLTNKSLNFGYVPAGSAPKILSISYVNDTANSQQVSTVEVESFYTAWNWVENENSFTPDRFTDTTAPDVFTLVASNCTGKELRSGDTCIIKIQFDPVKAASVNPAQTAFRARIKLIDSLNNQAIVANGSIAGQLHAIASLEANRIVYFPADSSDPSNPTKDKAYAPMSRIDGVLAVIDERLYTLGGLASSGESSAEIITDKDVGALKVYDTARNMWRKLKPSGDNPIAYMADGEGSVAVPAITVVNQKLYMVGGTYYSSKLKGKKMTSDLFSYDPYNTENSPDGHWKIVKIDGSVVKSQGASAASINGHLFLFGGYDSQKVINKFYVADLRDLTITPRWTEISASMKTDDPTLYPLARSNAAMVAHGDKLYLHGGDVATNATGTAQTQGGDLWEFTPKFDNKTGNLIIAESSWKLIHGETHSGIATKPAKRVKHSMSVVGGELYLAGMGFNWPYRPVDTNQKKYFKVTRPTDEEIAAYKAASGEVGDTTGFYAKAYTEFAVGGEDLKKLGSDGYVGGNGLLLINSGHSSASIEKIFWFHSVNIMGVLIK